MVLLLDGCLVFFALLALDLGRAETEGNTTDAVEIAARRVTDDGGLPVVPDFGGHLPTGRAKTGRSASRPDESETEAAAGSHNLTVRAHSRRFLLRL
jgi:hypothetical protein